jgi:hypothetical protein
MKVGDEYRSSNLSHTPGGVTVVVKLTNGKILEYDKIKYPNRYIDKVILKGNVKDAWVDESTEQQK